MKNHKTLNIISTVLLLISGILCFIVEQDNELSWALFPNDQSYLIIPIITFLSLISAVISYKKNRTTFNVILLIISGLLLSFLILLFAYVYALGSGWNH